MGKRTKWFRRAADREDPWAAGYLGIIYLEGIDVSTDFKAASEWFMRHSAE